MYGNIYTKTEEEYHFKWLWFSNNNSYNKLQKNHRVTRALLALIAL